MRPTLGFLLIIALRIDAFAQFQDPGFEQGGMGWVRQCTELTWLSPSTAAHGGSLAMTVQATSTDHPHCPSVDPEGGWTPEPRFYQALPQVIAGDVVRVRCMVRAEVGTPLPSATDVVPFAVTVDGEGLLHHPATDLTLSDGNLLAHWQEFTLRVTVPQLPAGQVFAVGFGAHAWSAGNAVVHFDNMALVVEGSGARLNAKAWLDGAFVPGSNLMRDDLRTAGLIPAAQPLLATGTATTPVGGESIAPGVLNVTGANAIVDWITVELRFGRPDMALMALDGYFQYYETYARRYALIQRDGDIVDMDGVSPVLLPIKEGNCHVVIRHRNHLGVMSAQPLALHSTAVVFDTRAAATPLHAMPAPYAGAARRTMGSTRTLWAGDTWSSAGQQYISYTGNGNDRDGVLFGIGGTIPTNTVAGYARADLNLDGVVKYTGANNDRDLILQTIGGTIPTAVRYEQVPGR